MRPSAIIGNRGIDHQGAYYVDILAFVMGFAQIVDINLIGRLFCSEAVAAVIAIYYVFSSKTLWDPLPRRLLMLCTLWLISAIITDLVRQSQFDDLARGWSRIVVFYVDFAALYCLGRTHRGALLWNVVGLGLAFIVEARWWPSAIQIVDPWKFGYSQGLTPIVALIAGSKSVTRILKGATWMPLLAIAAVNLIFNYRSVFGIAAAAGLMCMLKEHLNTRNSVGIPFSRGRIAVLALASIFVGQGIIGVYSLSASRGWLGVEAQDKYEEQSGSNLSLLQYGRGELFASTQAIIDSPLIGHGSWAQDFGLCCNPCRKDRGAWRSCTRKSL